MKKSFDIVVLGGGVLGLSTAFALAEQRNDLEIAIVSPPIDLYGASRAAGAMLGVYGEITEFGLRNKHGRYRHDLSVLAASMWPEWGRRVAFRASRDPVPINYGTFLLLNNQSSRLDDINFNAAVQAAKAFGAQYEDADPSRIPGYRPLDHGRASRAAFFPGEGWISASQHLSILLEALQTFSNVTLVQNSASELTTNSASIRGVKLVDDGWIECGIVVIAAGVSSSHLLKSALDPEAKVPHIFSGTGTSLLLTPTGPTPPYAMRTPNRSFSCGLHAVPVSNSLYIGATNNINAQPSCEPPLSDVSFLIDCAVDQISHDLEHASVKLIATGNRPVSSDTFPMIGPTSVRGLYSLTATYRDGFLLSPLLAAQVVDWVEQRPEHESLQHFRPERSCISVCTINEAIEQAIEYYLAVGSEHQIKLPRVGWQEMMHEMIREKVEGLYRELGSFGTLHPDMVSIIDRDRDGMLPFFLNELSGHEDRL